MLKATRRRSLTKHGSTCSASQCLSEQTQIFGYSVDPVTGLTQINPTNGRLDTTPHCGDGDSDNGS